MRNPGGTEGIEGVLAHERIPNHAQEAADVVDERSQMIEDEVRTPHRGDMPAILHGWAAFFASPVGVIAPTIIGAMPHDPELAEAFRDGVIKWRKHAMAEVLNRGIARGEVRPDVPVEVARELGQAILWHRFLVTGDPITDDLIEHIVDHILIPYVSGRAANEAQEAGRNPTRRRAQSDPKKRPTHGRAPLRRGSGRSA